jgi:DMSO/TMAO reductase YedYZ molybdopterin-dependent catalytic subunit
MGLKRLFWNYTGSTADYSTYFTPGNQFYHVDHGGIPAPIEPETWSFRVGGRVGVSRRFTLADLRSRIAGAGMTRYVKCLQCLRDPLGDEVEGRWYASSGLWGGLPLAALLGEVGVAPGSSRISYGGRDGSGFFASLPLEWAMGSRDGLPVLLVTELNGQPLSHARGGPVRLLVPDALGFKSMKWLDWLCVTDNPVPDGWYERGRGVRLPPRLKDPTLKTIARIAPVPGPGGRPVHPRHGPFRSGECLGIRGYAVAGPRGLAAVRFRIREGHAIGVGRIVGEGLASFEPPGRWGLGGPMPAGVIHFEGDRPMRWPLPLAWVYWQAAFGPLPRGRYGFEVWAVDAEGHDQPMPDPDEHSGSARREAVTFHVD